MVVCFSWWQMSVSSVKRMVWWGSVGSHVGRMPPTRWPTMAKIPLYTSRSSTRSCTDREEGLCGVANKSPSSSPHVTLGKARHSVEHHLLRARHLL